MVARLAREWPRRDTIWERDVEATWAHYEVWKSVANSLRRGLRDQSADFNKRKNEVRVFVLGCGFGPCVMRCAACCTVQSVPASWLIPVDGRAAGDGAAGATASTPAPEEVEEDAVCQVCFDGESLETNPIVFCDRCNIAIHKVCACLLTVRATTHGCSLCVRLTSQRCYGITIIPEGDYFCDRCNYLKYSGVNAEVVCCLCPVPDGAFKRTTDGRWVRCGTRMLSGAGGVLTLCLWC